MSNDFFDNQEIDLPCPNCGAKTRKSVRWIKNNSQFICSCGGVIDLKSEQFVRELRKVEVEIDKLKKSLGKFK